MGTVLNAQLYDDIWVKINTTSFALNRANYGGALYIYSQNIDKQNCNITISQSSFQLNYAAQYGGAIFLDNSDCQFT